MKYVVLYSEFHIHFIISASKWTHRHVGRCQRSRDIGPLRTASRLQTGVQSFVVPGPHPPALPEQRWPPGPAHNATQNAELQSVCMFCMYVCVSYCQKETSHIPCWLVWWWCVSFPTPCSCGCVGSSVLRTFSRTWLWTGGPPLPRSH